MTRHRGRRTKVEKCGDSLPRVVAAVAGQPRARNNAAAARVESARPGDAGIRSDAAGHLYAPVAEDLAVIVICALVEVDAGVDRLAARVLANGLEDGAEQADIAAAPAEAATRSQGGRDQREGDDRESRDTHAERRLGVRPLDLALSYTLAAPQHLQGN